MTKKVLIIDDDSKNIFALNATLKAKGITAVTATSAAEGIEKLLDDGAIAIVLMDMMMPEMDGYEAIQAIRGYNQYQLLPIIAVTAQAMTGDKEKCLQAGATGYISKPINVDDLFLMLNEYLK